MSFGARKTRGLILLAWLSCLAGSCVFPPWIGEVWSRNGNGLIDSVREYGFLWRTPYDELQWTWRVDFGVLIAQLLLISFSFAFLLALTFWKSPRSSTHAGH